MTVKRATVDQYTVKVEDRAAAEPITLTAEKIRVAADNITTAKNETGKLSLSMLLDQSATVKVNTAIGLDPLRADGKAEIAGVVLKRYAPYYQNLFTFDIEDGILDVATGYRVAQNKDVFDVKLAGLSTSLKTLQLKTRDTNQQFLSIPTFAVRNTAVDLSKQDITVGDLSTAQGTVLVVRARDGEINLAKLLPRATTAAATLADAPDASTSAPPPAAGQPARPWTVKATGVSVNQYRIQFTDETPSEPVNVTVEDVNVKAENLSTAENAPAGKVALGIRLGQGTVSVEGAASVAPVTADLQLAVKDLDIRPFQPYVDGQGEGHHHGRPPHDDRPPRTQHQRAERVAGHVHGRDQPGQVRRHRKEHLRRAPELGFPCLAGAVSRVQSPLHSGQEDRPHRFLCSRGHSARRSPQPPGDHRHGRGGQARRPAEAAQRRPPRRRLRRPPGPPTRRMSRSKRSRSRAGASSSRIAPLRRPIPRT